LRFVRRTSKLGCAGLATSSLASLPSLGVSSLDLGRTDFRAAPFISLTGARVRLLRSFSEP